jgi:RNA polymerase sigma factor (sigma-70 family)
MTERTRMQDLIKAELRGSYRYVLSRLFALALARFGLSKMEAEDLAHAALVRAIEHAQQYRPKEGVPLDRWLLKIAQRMAYDECRARRVRRSAYGRMAEEAVPDTGSTPEGEVLGAEAKHNRDRLLARLDPSTRIVFGLWARQHAGYITGEQAAAELGCSVKEYNDRHKKRVRRDVEMAMRDLGFTWKDVLSPAPTALHQLASVGGDDE